MTARSEQGSHAYTTPVVAPTGGWTSGDLVTIVAGATGLVGIAATTEVAGATGAVYCGGIYEVPKNTGTGESFNQGDLVYKDDSTGDATASATGNDLMGHAHKSATTSDTTVWVKFNAQR